MSTNLHMNSGPSGSFPKDQQLNACLSPLDLHTHYFEWKVGCQMTVVVVACSYIYTRALTLLRNKWMRVQWATNWTSTTKIRRNLKKSAKVWVKTLMWERKKGLGKETQWSVWLCINASQGIWSSQSVAVKKKESFFFFFYHLIS